MPERPAALVLSPEAPYPAAGGGALRTASLVEYLGRRTNLHLIVFREPGAADPRPAIPPGLAWKVDVLELPRSARNAPARVARNLGRLLRGVPPLFDRFAGFDGQIEKLTAGTRYAVAVIEHFWCAGYRDVLARSARHVVLDMHNVESSLAERFAAASAGPEALAHARFSRLSRKLEERLLPRFDLLLVPSEEDGRAVAPLARGVRTVVYPNTIPLVPRPQVRKEQAIVFSGNLEYHPNAQAVRFFRRAIWPLLAERWPSLVWKIVGKNPQAVRRILKGASRVQLTGPVDDAVPAIATARVAVAPLLAGSGTRVKILEAWAAGLPVVSTTIGAEGLPVAGGAGLVTADSPEEFAGAVSSWLASPETALRAGAAGRALYEEAFTWEAGWRALDRAGLPGLPGPAESP